MGAKEEIDSRVSSLAMGFIDKISLSMSQTLPGMILRGMEAMSGMLEEGEKNAWVKTIDQMVDKELCDSDTGDIMKELRKEAFPVGFVMTLVLKIKMFIIIIQSVMDIMGLDRQYDLLSKTTPHPAPVENLVASMMIDPARASENRLQLKRHGFDDTQIDNIILSHYAKIPEEYIRINYLRGNIDSDKMYERMRELGYTDTRIQEIIQTWTLYPGPNDLFTMVAHEAFEPEIYTKLGLGSEFPEEQVPWLEAQGISRDWAMKYWIAHWAQPSLEQGFEMLHRGIITRDELDMLFKVVEIPQFWRDKLMQMTYNVYTRVDTRRMHEMGVLTTEELVQAYQDQGYDAEKAVKMAEFTIKYNAESGNSLTRSVILDSFKSDLISRSDALELLQSTGYDENTADFYLTHEEYKLELEVQKMNLKAVEERYKLNFISETQARSALNKLNLRGTKIEALIDEWNLELYKYQDLPTKSELNDMLIDKVIDEGSWRELMSRRGYSYEHQTWYLKMINKYVQGGGTLPSRTDLQTFYKKKLISADEFRTEMRNLGYADRYIELYLNSI
jgi:hypothetical protein